MLVKTLLCMLWIFKPVSKFVRFHEGRATRSELYFDEEQKLWREMLTGNVTAYEQLINRTYDLLFHYGTKFNSDRELIKDCIQDVFLGIWEKRDALNPEIPPRPYLLASLRRRLHRLASRLRMDCMDYYNESDIVFDLEFSAEYRLIQTEHDRLLASRMTEMLNGTPETAERGRLPSFLQ